MAVNPGDEVDDTETPAVAPATTTADATPPAATPAAAPTTPYSVDDLVVGPAQRDAITSKLIGIKQQQAGQSAAVADQTVARLRADREDMNKAFKATALDPNDLQNWDQRAKQAEYRTDPVEAFGSVGSVFAMLASSFAGLPMQHALNAGAAAINAVHAQDEKAYNREFDAWKANTDLALKRHEIMRQAYNDSILKMNTNLNAGRSELELSARKYGDQTAIAMLEAGLDGDLNKLIDGRNKSALELRKTMDEVELQHEKTMDLKNDPRWLSGNQTLRAAAMKDWQERWTAGGRSQAYYDGRKDYVEQQKKLNPEYTPDDVLKWNQDYGEVEAAGKTANKGSPKAQEIERRTTEYMKPLEEGGLGLDRTAAFDRASKEVATAGKPEGTESSQARKSRGVKEIIDRSRKEVEAGTRSAPMTTAEAEAEYNRTVATPSGNRLDDIDKQIGMYENGTNAIDKTLSLIDKHVGSVGAAGYATRLGERLGNIVGSNETDRSQIAHDIQYLQTVAPRLMQDASSRGLKAEADKINSIVAGLNIGDTTANVKRALTEVRSLWEKMKQDNINRRRGVPSPTSGAGPVNGAPAAPAAPKSKSVPAWQQAPVIGPRSSLEEDEFAA